MCYLRPLHKKLYRPQCGPPPPSNHQSLLLSLVLYCSIFHSFSFRPMVNAAKYLPLGFTLLAACLDGDWAYSI